MNPKLSNFLLLAVLLSTACSRSSYHDWPTYRFKIGETQVECRVACNVSDYSRGFRNADKHVLDTDPDEAKGICFVFPSDRIMTFSMAGVEFPLDLVLVSSQGKVTYATVMEPNSQSIYSSDRPARIALELRAGLIKKAHIAPGDLLFTQREIFELSQCCHF